MLETCLPRAALIEQISHRGSLKDISEVPAEIRQVFVVSQDITAEEHVRMQAALQAFVDNNLSKTINIPSGVDPEDISSAYRLA